MNLGDVLTLFAIGVTIMIILCGISLWRTDARKKYPFDDELN